MELRPAIFKYSWRRFGSHAAGVKATGHRRQFAGRIREWGNSGKLSFAGGNFRLCLRLREATKSTRALRAENEASSTRHSVADYNFIWCPDHFRTLATTLSGEDRVINIYAWTDFEIIWWFTLRHGLRRSTLHRPPETSLQLTDSMLTQRLKPDEIVSLWWDHYGNSSLS